MIETIIESTPIQGSDLSVTVMSSEDILFQTFLRATGGSFTVEDQGTQVRLSLRLKAPKNLRELKDMLVAGRQMVHQIQEETAADAIPVSAQNLAAATTDVYDNFAHGIEIKKRRKYLELVFWLDKDEIERTSLEAVNRTFYPWATNATAAISKVLEANSWREVAAAFSAEIPFWVAWRRKMAKGTSGESWANMVRYGKAIGIWLDKIIASRKGEAAMTAQQRKINKQFFWLGLILFVITLGALGANIEGFLHVPLNIMLIYLAGASIFLLVNALDFFAGNRSNRWHG